MHRLVREHLRGVAAVLSVVSLALVIGTAGGVVPGSLLPQFDPLVAAIPHLNATISLVAIAVILTGLRAIRAGRVKRHRRAMITGFGLFAGFLVLYLYRVAIHGPTPFDGPAWFATFVYYPILGVHILLAVICVPLLYYVALLGLLTPVEILPDTLHPRLGRVTVALWVTSFGLGLVIYGLLYLG